MSDVPSPAPESKSNRTTIIFVVAVLIGAILLLIISEWASITGSKPDAPADSGAIPPAPDASAARVGGLESTPAPGPTAVRAFGSSFESPAEPVPDSHPAVVNRLNARDHDARADVAILAELFAHYLGELRELPVGNNAEVTAALAGDNARAYVVVPARHPAINASGELTDRWGTPYFFHQLSGDLMEIRSPGPDRRRYTADDVVWPTEAAPPGAAPDPAAALAAAE